MRDLVVPKVSAEWEDVAFALRYEISVVKQISGKHKEDQKSAVKNCLRTGLKPVMVLNPRYGKPY